MTRREETWSRREETLAGREIGIFSKKECDFSLMQETALTEAARSVPRIDVLAAPPKGARQFAGPFYPDQTELLSDTLKGLRDRSRFIVAPDASGEIHIYWRARK